MRSNAQRAVRGSRSRGRVSFTLIELVAVAVIIAIVAALAVPRLANSIALHRAEATARRVALDISLTRRQARLSGTPMTIEFDAASESYAIPGVDDADRPGADYTVDLAEHPYEADLVTVDFGGQTKATFDGYGQPVAGGGVQIRVGNHARDINVDGVTGEVTIN